jgi:hypothetical protein
MTLTIQLACQQDCVQACASSVVVFVASHPSPAASRPASRWALTSSAASDVRRDAAASYARPRSLCEELWVDVGKQVYLGGGRPKMVESLAAGAEF